MVYIRPYFRKGKIVNKQGHERKIAYKKFKKAINMNLREAQEWQKNECSKKASLSSAPLNRAINLLKTPENKCTNMDIKNSKRVVSLFLAIKLTTLIARNSKQKAGKRKDGCPSKATIAGRNWLYDRDKTKNKRRTYS